MIDCFLNFLLKTFQCRYAEKLFWCIEAVRSPDDEERLEAISKINAPRTIEFYYFLQGYLHTIPQIFLQLHILLRYLSETEKPTGNLHGNISSTFRHIR